MHIVLAQLFVSCRVSGVNDITTRHYETLSAMSHTTFI